MTEAQYGSWKSPITSNLIVQGTIKLEQVMTDGENIYWIENRPAEAGRNVIVKRSAAGQIADVIASPYNARSRVHEYGGGSYLPHNDTVYFSHFGDSCLYRVATNFAPQPLTHGSGMHYADGVMDPIRQRMVWVREDHSISGTEPINSLVSISLDDPQLERVIVSGEDFYASPRFSPDGNWLVWVSWNHPNMPWDSTQLWMAQVNADGSLADPLCIAGAAVSESIVQPEWSPDGTLYFVSDRSGWWNIYRFVNDQIEPVVQMPAEFGRPHWVFGQSCYAFESDKRIICTYGQKGLWHLAEIDTSTGQLSSIETPYTEISYLRAQPGKAVFCAGSHAISNSIVQVDLASKKIETLRSSSNLSIDPSNFSTPEALAFPTENSKTAYAFFYPPHNPQYTAPAGQLPPLIVKSHGGPTSACSSILNLQIQYWTSRGIAVLDVNYGGSTGFGREYRQRLNEKWGIVDVDDCTNGAEYLVESGQVDPNRLIISGGSAGGYTTLCALTFKDTFKAGASYYGISDLESLATDTHKFESRYTDGLVGPYPKRQDLYFQRSPINFPDKLSCPIIFLQGSEDKVVPPAQSEMMVKVLRSKVLPVAYLLFPGEQHGFRQADTIRRALDAEFYFYSRIFNFQPADNIEPIKIDNLDQVT